MADIKYEDLTKEVQDEIPREMWEGLRTLKSRLKSRGWTNLKYIRERSSKEIFVVEAVDPTLEHHKHWFEVCRNGDLIPCITFMGLK